MCIGASIPPRVRLIESDQLTSQLVEKASDDLIDITCVDFESSKLYAVIEPPVGEATLKMITMGIKLESNNLASREEIIKLIEDIIDGKKTYANRPHISTVLQGGVVTVSLSS